MSRVESSPILIDITKLLEQFNSGVYYTGIMRVCLAYVEHYHNKAQAVIQWNSRSFILPARESKQLFELLLSPKTMSRRHVARTIKIRFLILKGICSLKKKQALSKSVLFKIDYADIERSTYLKKQKRQGVRPVFVLHDLIPIEHGEFFQPHIRDLYTVRLEKMLRLGSGIITVSQTTLDALINYTANSAFDLPQTTAVLLAPGKRLAVSPGNRTIATPYFVVIGTIEPRKNYCFLLLIWQQLIKNLGNKAPRLVIIGQRGWECENVLALLERSQQLKEFVVECPCSDQDSVTFLSHSQALLFPSFAEGYGLPIVEALSLGVPVIASDLPVFREFAGDIPDYIDPLDGRKWLDTIELYTSKDCIARAQQLNRIKDFKAPTWTDYFTKVDEFLKKT